MSPPPDKRGRGRPKTVDRPQAIRVAMETYWREGLDAVSLSELCRRAGLSKPSLYRTFGGEDGLMDAALEHYRQLAVVPLLSLFASAQPASGVLASVVAALTADRGVPAGCLFTKMRLSQSRLGPKTLERVTAIEQERLEAMEVWYRRAVGSGEVNPALAPAFAARYLDTQLSTVLVQMGAGASADRVRAEAELALKALVANTT